MEKETARKIREAVHSGTLPPHFTGVQVNKVPGIHWAGNFLPKHRVGNPRNETELFVRVRPGLYRLRSN